MKKVCDTLDVKGDLLCEVEVATVQIRLKNSSVQCADCVVNKFFKYGGFEVRNKLLKIMSLILIKGKYLAIFEKP